MGDETRIVAIAGQTVVIAYDQEAGVWYVHSSAVHGLTGEGVSVEGLIEELRVTVRTLGLP
jgi:hypothetical protein